MSITFSNVPDTARASKVFVEQEAVSRGTGSEAIPHKILIMGQYNSGFSPEEGVPKLISSREQAWELYGRGSQLSRMLERVLDNCGTVSVYACPLAADGAAVSAAGSFVITGPATAAGALHLYVEGEEVTVSVASGDTASTIGDSIADAINADLDLPVTASNIDGTVTLTCRWAGESGNGIDLALNLDDDDETPAGLEVTVTDLTGGATDPDLTDTLAALGDTWFTEIVSPFDSSDALTALVNAGDDRNDPGVKRQILAFVGYTDTYDNYLTELGSWNSEWLSFIPVCESASSPYMIAAAACAVWAKYQQATPGRPVRTLKIPDVLSADGNDLTYTQKNTGVLAGGSYTENRSDGSVQFGDVCTTRTTTDAGAATDDYQFAVIIANLQFKIYALENKFLASPYDRGVVVSDGAGRKPSYAVTPNMVKADAIALVDDWIERGLSTDRADIVDNIEAEINSSNPGRIDLLIPDVASAGLRIVGLKLEWGFTS
ncbi:MAG: hypothetical protein PQJ59_01805 [Spirochaetales bacterium]|nr:hypothetical protein [Spirochaetales bacterium]